MLYKITVEHGIRISGYDNVSFDMFEPCFVGTAFISRIMENVDDAYVLFERL